MSSSTVPSFEKRSRQIARRHRSVTRRGGEMHLGPDGLLTVRARRGKTGIPFRGVLLIVGLLFAAKALMLYEDGATAYGERVTRLAEGNGIEQVGAWIMQADPLSAALAHQLRQILG